MARQGQKMVTVYVDEAVYAKAAAGKPRGWLSEVVRAVLEDEVNARATPELIDFGAADENPAIEVKVHAGNDPSDRPHPNPVPDQARHLFRRGQLHTEVRQNGNVERTYECACGCGEIR